MIKRMLALFLALGLLLPALPMALTEDEEAEYVFDYEEDEEVEYVFDEEEDEETEYVFDEEEDEDAEYVFDEEEEGEVYSYSEGVEEEEEEEVEAAGLEDDETEEVFAETFLPDSTARVIFWTCLGLAILSCCLLLLRKDVPYGLLAFAVLLTCGLMLVLCKPASYTYLSDEAGHFENVQVFTESITGSLRNCINLFIHYNLGYLPLAAGSLLGKALGLDSYLSAAVCSMLCYALLCALAVKHAPKFKLSFLAFAAMPACLFSAAGFSYDGTIISCALLGLALVLEEWSRPHERLTGGKAIVLCLTLGAGLCAKPAYNVLLLLTWFLPKEKFGGRGRQWLFRIFVLLLLVLCLAGSLTGAYDAVSSGDARFDGTDSRGQLQYILQHPGEFLALLLAFMARNWSEMIFTCFGSLAYLGISYWGGIALSIFLLLLPPLDGQANDYRRPTLTAARRVLLLLLGLLPPLILTITQYLVSTPVGHDGISGMQGRYFLPVWPLLLLALMLPRKLRHTVSEKAYRWITIAVVLVLLAANFWLTGSMISAARA